MSFLSGIFLTALVAAAGPTIIHLLNRRRRQTIYWGPMDFLREVIKRNRRILQLRDLLLLVVRTLVVILFVVAMARPYWTGGQDDEATDRPVHAVLVIDNSLSMAYTELDTSLLGQAKIKTREFVESLPSGSEISVIPLCGYTPWQIRDVHTTTEDALEAVDRIEIADRSVPITEGLAQASEASRLASGIPTKRLVFVGDAQRRSWSLDGAETYLDGLDGVQMVRVGPADRTNTWVADFTLLHGIADTQTSAVFRATIRHEGADRTNVPVALTIGETVIEQEVNLVGGQERRLDFTHTFRVAGTSGQPRFVPAELKLGADRLTLDDSRTLIVPVVARTPVVFIDQYGTNERPQDNMFGETARVRRLLMAGSRRTRGRKHLIQAVRRTIANVTRDDLKDARLVVIAGVQSPTPEAVAMLREYVEQGGNIFIGAGEAFDPTQWTATAWLDGAGILPAPLKDLAIGQIHQPGRAAPASFGLDKPSIVGRALYLDATPEETGRILDAAKFYKAVAVDIDTAREAISQAERKRIVNRRKLIDAYEADEKRWSDQERAGTLSSAESSRREAARLAEAARSPRWLAWANPLARENADFSVDDLVNATQPRVLGRYDNGHPFVVQRQIGKGRVVMLTTGMWPVWNTLALDHGVLLLDRIMRSLLVRSLPDRTFGPERQIVIPVPAADQMAAFTVKRPGDSEGLLQSVEALGPRSFGLMLRSVQQRGVYRIERRRARADGDEATPDKAAPMELAVNGPAAESELAPRAEADLPTEIGSTKITWTGPDEAISLAGRSYAGRDFWEILMALALVCVLLEMVLLTGWRLAGLPKSGQTEPTSTPKAGGQSGASLHEARTTE